MEKVLIVTMLVSFIIVVLLAPLMIPLLHRLKFGQSIRHEGPQSHLKKAGTPTMGGLIIVIAVLLTVWKFAPSTTTMYLLVIVFIGYSLIGFLDDFIIIYFKRSLGLTAKQKLFAQLVIALIFYFVLMQMEHSTVISIPGTSWSAELGLFYFPLVLFLLVGASNATNLTDGLDGLLAGTAAIAFGAFALLAWRYTDIEIAVFTTAIVGALLGFLVYNAHPAKVFMGDTGSLGLGGAIAAVAIIGKMEILLAIIGGVFVLEALSVILQVFFYKTKQKRIFKMSPLHHHFELSGWSEWRVVTLFWVMASVCAGVGICIEVFMR